MERYRLMEDCVEGINLTKIVVVAGRKMNSEVAVKLQTYVFFVMYQRLTFSD